MKLNTNSWHYKLWASTFERFERPFTTDLCRYCHRVFWRLVLYVLLACAVGGSVLLLGYCLIYRGLILNTFPTLMVVGAIAAVFALLVVYMRWLHSGRKHSEPRTLVGKFAQASKDKVCPLVEFTDDTPGT